MLLSSKQKISELESDKSQSPVRADKNALRGEFYLPDRCLYLGSSPAVNVYCSVFVSMKDPPPCFFTYLLGLSILCFFLLFQRSVFI